MCDASTTHSSVTQLAPQGSQTFYCHFFSCNISSSYLVLSHLSPAIYNYDARGEEELSLQIGDTVHILETYEGETGLVMAHVIRADITLIPLLFCQNLVPMFNKMTY